MNAAHLHLMLNHLPLVGTAFGLALLARGQWKKSDELKRVSLGLLVLVTVLAVPAYLTGEPAEEIVEKMPGVEHSMVEQHEEAAQVAFIAQIVLGVGALGGLLFFRRGRTIPNWFAGAILVIALVVSGLMARTANLGGEVRHPEIRSGASPAAHTE
jgi:uncharacterized membrane protein